MYSGGRYVRAPGTRGSGRWSISENQEDVPYQVEQDTGGGQNSSSQQIEGHNASEAMREDNRAFLERMNRFEGALNQMQEMFASSYQPGHVELPPRDEVWCRNTRGQSSTSGINLRYENIQPFPEDVLGNQMWAEWNKFIDRFEISISLADVDDQIKRAQMLFLAMGPQLQGIITAARLRPKLDDPDVYNRFVHNVERYLHSMIDVNAEHEMFQNLKQEPDEATFTFHARLMEKVRLCRYSEADEDRFVRTQLLNGMSNQDVAEMGHKLALNTASILQMASRTESRPKKAPPTDVVSLQPKAFTVEQEKHRALNRRDWNSRFETTEERSRHHRDGEAHGSSPGYPGGERSFNPSKRRPDASVNDQRKQAVKHRGGEGDYRNPQRAGRDRRGHEPGRRARCSRCNKLFHRFG